MKTIAVISTYGAMKFGTGHDTTTPGSIKDEGYRISTSNGASDFERLLQRAVKRWDLRRGDEIVISIERHSMAGSMRGTGLGAGDDRAA